MNLRLQQIFPKYEVSKAPEDPKSPKSPMWKIFLWKATTKNERCPNVKKNIFRNNNNKNQPKTNNQPVKNYFSKDKRSRGLNFSFNTTANKTENLIDLNKHENKDQLGLLIDSHTNQNQQTETGNIKDKLNF